MLLGKIAMSKKDGRWKIISDTIFICSVATKAGTGTQTLLPNLESLQKGPPPSRYVSSLGVV